MGNMAQKRDRRTIVAEILEAAADGKNKAQITHAIKTNYVKSALYLSYLVEKGLLEGPSIEGTYRTTRKGKKYLRYYDGMRELVPFLFT